MGVYVRVYVGRRGVPILGPYNHTVVDSKVVTDVGVVSILGNKPGRSQLFMCCFLPVPVSNPGSKNPTFQLPTP